MLFHSIDEEHTLFFNSNHIIEKAFKNTKGVTSKVYSSIAESLQKRYRAGSISLICTPK